MRWRKTHKTLLEASQNVLLNGDSTHFLLWLWFWLSHSSLLQTALEGFPVLLTSPYNFSWLSVLIQTELLQYPTHCALLKGTLLHFSCGGMQLFTSWAWFLVRNRLHEFSIFLNGVPVALYTLGWFVLAAFETLLSMYIFLLANITSNTVSASSQDGLRLLWCAHLFIFKVWSLVIFEENNDKRSIFDSSTGKKRIPWRVHNLNYRFVGLVISIRVHWGQQVDPRVLDEVHNAWVPSQVFLAHELHQQKD